MEINIKGSGSTKSFSLSGVDPSITVLELKKLCQAECSLTPDCQRLFLKGKLLKDEDLLRDCKLEKATLFLVKGAGTGGGEGGASGSTSSPEKKDDAAEPLVSVPCAGGCGFYGTAKTENYCSKCFSKKQKDEVIQKPEEPAPQEEKKEDAKEEEAAAAEPEVAQREEQKDKTKCWTCSKKCGLTGFECRCGYVFCSKHRYAEDHDCDFDHKGKGREILAKNNQNVAISEKDLLDGV